MKHIQKHDIAELSAHLHQLDPDVGYADWPLALMVLFNETGGGEEGFEMVDAWSRTRMLPERA